jgi:hypothetical protein
MGLQRFLSLAFVGCLGTVLVAGGAQAGKLKVTRFQLLAVGNGEQEVRDVPNGGVVRYAPDTCYAWQITFRPTTGKLKFVEELILPAPAKQWGTNKAKVRADRSSALTDVVVDGQSGEAGNTWCVAAGDPEGKYRFIVRYNKKIIGDGRFILTSFAPPALPQ